MGRSSIYAAIVAVGLLSGCQTPYQPNGFGGGYEDLRLSDDTFEVRARGNGYSSEEHTRDIMLLRASELALKNGFSHFIITNGSMRDTTQLVATMPGTVQTNAQATFAGNTIYGTANSTYQPPQDIYATNHHGVVTVKMFHQEVPGALSAQLIYDQLHPKLAG